MRSVRIVWGLAVALLALAACQSQAANPPATPAVIVLTPAATAPALPPTPSGPTPSADQVGTVTGQLVRLHGSATPEEALELRIYLGTVHQSENGKDALVGASRDTSPFAQTDLEGNFTFVNVPPGRYGLMLDTPDGLVLLNDPKTGGDMIVEVMAGKTSQMGRMEFDLPF